MNLNDYQQQASQTAIYPPERALEYLSLGLVAEAGEAAGMIAKHYRGDGNLDGDELAKELGDILWFIALLADDMHMPLSAIAEMNLDKLASRQARGKLQGSGDDR